MKLEINSFNSAIQNSDAIPTELKARVLVQALPYIQQCNGKIVVIKYGGNAMINSELKNAVMTDIVLLSLVGVNVVLVHGGGPEITETLEKMGKKKPFCKRPQVHRCGDGRRGADGAGRKGEQGPCAAYPGARRKGPLEYAGSTAG